MLSEENRLQRNLRLLLIVLSVAIVMCSLAALGFALWTPEALVERIPLSPTLFAPP
jgi:hypothetical protein